MKLKVDELIDNFKEQGGERCDFWQVRASLEIARQLERLEDTLCTAVVELSNASKESGFEKIFGK